MSQTIEVGHLVAPKNPSRMLHCGSGFYDCAVVASTEPFVLVSEDGDMCWTTTVRPEDFQKSV